MCKSLGEIRDSLGDGCVLLVALGLAVGASAQTPKAPGKAPGKAAAKKAAPAKPASQFPAILAKMDLKDGDTVEIGVENGELTVDGERVLSEAAD